MIKELGYMIDCSRGAVAKIDQLKKLCSILKKWGYTYVMLYTEDTFEVENEPYFGYARGRYTKEEIKELDSYCQSIGLELRACIETLAHLGRLMAHSKYREMFDLDDILIVGDPRTHELLDNMFASIASMYSSKVVHIGMDEAWKLGRGKYLNKNGYKPISDIMQEHLNMVCELAKKYGFTLQIWGDMLANAYYEGIYNIKLPENITPFIWRYYPIGDEGTEKEIKLYKKLSTNKLAYAGGAHKWSGFVPGNNFSFYSIAEQIKGCKKFGITNYLLTAWGDGAADASLFSTLPAIFYASLMAKGRKLTTANKRLFKEVVGMSFDNYLTIDKLNRMNEDPQYQTSYTNLSFVTLYNDPLQNLYPEFNCPEYKDGFKKEAKDFKRLAKNNEFGYIFNTMASFATLLSSKCDLEVNIMNAYQKHDIAKLNEVLVQLKECIKNLETFMSVYETQWHKENKSFGYEKQCIRLGGLLERLKYVSRMIKRYLNHEVDVIEELEITHLPSDYMAGRPFKRDCEDFHKYAYTVSSGLLNDI